MSIKVFIVTSNKVMYREVAQREFEKEGMDWAFCRSIKFDWGNINMDYMSWSQAQYARALQEEEVRKAWSADMKLMTEADALLLIGPAGRSSHLLAGFAAAIGKKTYAWLTIPQYPDLEYCMFDSVSHDLGAIIKEIRANG